MTPAANSEPTTLLIPCETFSVKAVLVPSGSLTVLERLVLRALHAGASDGSKVTIDTLNQLFAIGYRPMMRLVLDFLNRALVTFNFDTGAIRVTPGVVELIKTNRLDEIEAGGRTEEEIGLMRDRVAGTILMRRPQPPMKPSTRVPGDQPPNSPATLTSEDIALAIRAQVRKRLARGDRPRHVVEIAIDYSKGGQTRDLQIEVNPLLDEATDRLSVRVIGPDDLPSRTRSALEKKLTELANAQNPQNVFKVLRQRAVKREETAPPGLHAKIRELRRQFEELKVADPGTVESRQAKMQNLAVALDDMISRADNVVMEIITNPRRHAEAITAMIRSAQRQIVIACPAAQREATMQFRDAIESAVEKGRRLFFLFGRRDSDINVNVDKSIFVWLAGLKQRFPDRVFFRDDVAARCNGRFVIADGGDLLVSSDEFLRHPAGRTTATTAVRLTAASSKQSDERHLSQAALDLLALSKTIFPDRDDAEQMTDSAFRLGTFAAGALADVALPLMPRLRDDDPYRQQRLLLWMREWERRVARVETEGARVSATHEAVKDDEHFQWLHSALRTAQQRLVIVSRAVSNAAVRRKLLDDLKACLNRPGMRVAIVYGNIDREAYRTLQRLRDQHADQMQLVPWDLTRASAVRFLVCDDWCVVGGFDFLGSAVARADRYLVPAEVGVRLDGAELVDALLADLTTTIPLLSRWKEGEVATPVTPADVTPPLRRPITVLLDAIEHELGNDERREKTAQRRLAARALRKWFADAVSAEDAYAELAEIESIRAPFLDQAIAACLDIHRLPADHFETKHWFRRLVENRWRGGDFAGTLFLLGAAPGVVTPSVPPAPVAMLAARVAARSATAELFEDVSMHELDSPGAIALAALGLPMVLMDRENPARTMTDINEALPKPLQKWVTAIVDFRTYQPSGLDLADVESMSQSRSRLELRKRAKDTLKVDLERCIALHLDFTIGKYTWLYLINKPLGFIELLRAAEAGDFAVMRKFLQENKAADAERILDQASRVVVEQRRMRDERIEGDHRRLCLTRINNVLRGVAVVAGDEMPGVPPARLQERILTLSRALVADRAAVLDVAARLGNDAYPSVLLSGLQSNLAPLLELA
jgi:hypothetical protein